MINIAQKKTNPPAHISAPLTIFMGGDVMTGRGIDIIHGHSSHHFKGLEVYRGRLTIYGCGDFINDYEGIGGYEAFRADLALMYLASVNPATGKLLQLKMTPFQIRRFRLNRLSGDDALWVRDVLNREGHEFGTRVQLHDDDSLTLYWA